MSITFVGSNTGTGTISNISVALPAMAQNDLVVLFVGSLSGTHLASGYTQIANLSSSFKLDVSYKLMGVSPDTTVVVSTANVLTTVAALVFRGVHTTTMLDVAFTSADQISQGGNPKSPPITPTSNDCCIVLGCTAGYDTSVGSVSNYLPSPSVQIPASSNLTTAAAYQILSGGASVSEAPLSWSTWLGSYIAITIALRPLTASVNFVTVDQATITATGKTVVERETVPVLKASVGYAGRTVTIPDGLIDNITVDKYRIAYTGKSVEPLDIVRSVTVTQASVLYRGRIVTPRDVQFEDIPRYSVRGRGSGHWMETR